MGGKACLGLETGAFIFLWNVMISTIAVYFMFKPVQYYKQTMESTDDTYLISPKCQLDSIDQLTEHMLTICVIISVSFIFLQPILGIANCLARKATTMHHR